MGWSPLTTIVRTPAWASSATASGTPGRNGSRNAANPTNVSSLLGVRGIPRNPSVVTLGHGDDPQPIVRELRNAREHGRPLCLGHGTRVEHGLRRPLRGHPCTARIAPHRALALAHRIERIPAQALARRRLTRGLRQRAIDRVLRGRRPVRRRRHGQHALAVAVDAFDPEPVLGQRPGLVGEQHGHRPDSLGRTQSAQEHAVLRQSQTADRDEHRHEDRQLLGDRGERERQPVEQHLACGLAAEHADERHDNARRHRHDEGGARQLGHRALERRGRLPGLFYEPAQAADLGLGADRDDDPLAGACHHGAAGIEQRGPLGERRVGVDRLGPLGSRHGFPRQSGLVGGQAVGLDDAGVGGDDAAGLDEQHIADDERVDRDCGHGAIPADEGVRGAEVAQRPQCALRPYLGDRLDDADQRDHHEDRDRVAQLPEDRREHADHDQQQLEGLHDRLEQLAEKRHGLAALGAHDNRAAPLLDLVRRQPARATAGPLPHDRQGLCVSRDDGGPFGGGRRRRHCAPHVTDDTSRVERRAERRSSWDHRPRGA